MTKYYFHLVRMMVNNICPFPAPSLLYILNHTLFEYVCTCVCVQQLCKSVSVTQFSLVARQTFFVLQNITTGMRKKNTKQNTKKRNLFTDILHFLFAYESQGSASKSQHTVSYIIISVFGILIHRMLWRTSSQFVLKHKKKENVSELYKCNFMILFKKV